MRHGTVSAGSNTRAKQEALKALKEVPQPTLASRLMSATHDETFFLTMYTCVRQRAIQAYAEI